MAIVGLVFSSLLFVVLLFLGPRRPWPIFVVGVGAGDPSNGLGLGTVLDEVVDALGLQAEKPADDPEPRRAEAG